METSALASGSSGNCFYVGVPQGGILIDAGINAKHICEKLDFIGKKPEGIKAIFITHEHIDHIRGAAVFARRYNLPVYATKKTLELCNFSLDESLTHPIKSGETIFVAGMQVTSFSKSHKAADPVSFTVNGGKQVSVITDLGYCCKRVHEAVSESDFLYLESNHDERMLAEGPYPPFLKAWVRGDSGHLSNRQAGLCVLEYGSAKLQHIVLSHISKTNNTPSLAKTTFKKLVQERSDLVPKVHLSVREMPSPLFHLPAI